MKYFSKEKSLLLTTLIVTTTGVSVQADPIPNPPVEIPVVYCLRITDVEDTADPNRFKFMFQPLNWADQKAYGLFMSVNKAGVGQPGERAFFVKNAATVDENGRPFGTDDDDLNFQPNDLTGTLPSPKIPGPINNWAPISNTRTHVEYLGNYGMPFRDLLNKGNPTTIGACSLVPGCTVVNGKPVIVNMETVDNGWPISIDNVLDGLVVEIGNLTPGKFFSFNWFLLDQNGDPIGSLGFGNQFGFGTFNIYRAKNGDIFPLELPWGVSGNVGVSQNSKYAFKTATSLGVEFGFEAGAAITGKFLNGNDNPGVRDDTPLSITLSSFDANLESDGTVSISWVTGIETNNAAFAVWRGRPSNGICSNNPENYTEVKQVSPLVFSRDDSRVGTTYSHIDTNMGTGKFCYVLEDRDYNGNRTFHMNSVASVTIQ
jgi:hypothetical protein